MVKRGQNYQRKKCHEYERYDEFLRPLLVVLRPCPQPALEQGLVVNREIDGEAYGGGGEGGQENPALPIMERPSRPENESNKKKSAEYPLQGGLLIERIHFKTVHPRRPTSTPTSYHHNLQCLGSKDSNVARPRADEVIE